MPQPQMIFITGAGGYIGGSIAEKLVKAGLRERWLVRSTTKAELHSTRGLESVVGDLAD
jgi:nucleoside-diphosphate-sugar epimerase